MPVALSGAAIVFVGKAKIADISDIGWRGEAKNIVAWDFGNGEGFAGLRRFLFGPACAGDIDRSPKMKALRTVRAVSFK